MADNNLKSRTRVVVVPRALALGGEAVAWAWDGPDRCRCYEHQANPPQGAHVPEPDPYNPYSGLLDRGAIGSTASATPAVPSSFTFWPGTPWSRR